LPTASAYTSGLRARRLRFTDADALVRATQATHEIVESLSLEHLGEERTADAQMRGREFLGQFHQMHRTRLIDGGHATHVGRHVRKHKIHGRAIKQVFQLFQHAVLAEVAVDELDAADTLHRQDVERDDASLLTQALARDLRPPARRRAEVDDDHARLEQMVAIDQFFEFEDRA
jgi:hypothetical protein